VVSDAFMISFAFVMCGLVTTLRELGEVKETFELVFPEPEIAVCHRAGCLSRPPSAVDFGIFYDGDRSVYISILPSRSVVVRVGQVGMIHFLHPFEVR